MSFVHPSSIPEKPLCHSVIWLVCRVLLLLWGIIHFFFGYTTEFLQSIFAVAFTFLWDMFQLWGGKSFITQVSFKCQTRLNIFICFGCVVGTTLNKHTDFQYTDILLHFIAGYIACASMYEFAALINGRKRQTGPAMRAMFALAGAVLILVGWEIYEFSMDRIYGMNLQLSDLFSGEGLTDTMWDLIIGSFGALIAMFVEIRSFVKNNNPEKKEG